MHPPKLALATAQSAAVALKAAHFPLSRRVGVKGTEQRVVGDGLLSQLAVLLPHLQLQACAEIDKCAL